MKKQLQQTLKIAVLLNAKNEIIQLHKKIKIYRKFIQMKYFEIMKMFFEITVDQIRNEIRKTINKFSQLNCIDDSESFFSNRSSSLLSINFVLMLNNFFFKFLKMRFKSKKIEKTLIIVKQKNSIRQTIALYEINRRIIFNRIAEKHISAVNDRKNRMFLTFVKKTAFFRFVNQFVALKFFFRLSILIEKIVLLFRQRNIN